jgi:uncharacterized membrane protein YoaK (UPF0700 family)
MHKGFDYLFSNENSKEDSSKLSARLATQILASMWISFIFGAVTGAVMVTSLHSIGLLGIVLVLIPLTFAELRVPKVPKEDPQP